MYTLTPQWEYVADGVMGGVSQGTLQNMTVQARQAAVLRGRVSLDNNGGFIQMACDLRADGAAMDASTYDGIEVEVCGNGEPYDIRLRTDQLTRPWQSFRLEMTAPPNWQTLRLPFVNFAPHRVEARFDPSRLRRIGVLAIGRVFEADIAVAGLRLYRA